MSEVLKQPVVEAPEFKLKSSLGSYLPSALAVGGALLLTFARVRAGGENFISDGALMMLALAAYLIAAVFYLLNLYAPSSLYERIGLGSATLGVLDRKSVV